MTTADAILVLDALADAGIGAWVEGGWGIDALLGRQTREHDDIDLAISVDDSDRLIGVLAARGYRLSEGEPTMNFVLLDDVGRQVDLHPVRFDASGNGIYRMARGGDWVYPAQGFGGRGRIGDREVRCLSPEVQILTHDGYELDDDDHRDLAAVRDRFGLSRPDTWAMTVATGRAAALDRLLASDEPAIRHGALTQLLGRPADDPEVRRARAGISSGRLVVGLLAGRQSDGGFGKHPYGKWGGAHWRLVSLADLGVPPETAGLREAFSTVLDWLTSSGHVDRVPVIDGLARRCGSQEGNALFVAAHLGVVDEPRVRQLAMNLVGWQWPDGGWNCDKRRGVTHSSFNESLPPLLGLAAWADATGDRQARAAADRAAEFLLRHRVMFSERTGQIAHPNIARLRYPPFWHYDVLAALKALERSGHLDDPRTSEALEFLESKRRPDGMWHPDGYHWKSPGSKGSNVEVVDWGRRGPSEPLTLGALRVLKAAGRWSP